MDQQPTSVYRVVGTTLEAPGVSTLKLLREDGTKPTFVAGQYLIVYFPELGTPEGKAYSISSAPQEPTLAITVRAIGKFSNRLCALKVGDRITAAGPFGYFYSESPASRLVLLAGGVGIMPFRSIILDTATKAPTRELALFYSMRTSADAVFRNTFEALSAQHEQFTTHYFVTREAHPKQPMVPGRMSANLILSTIPASPDNEFLLCGSIAFVRDLWRDLRDKGVPEEALYTEAFFIQ